MKLKIFKKKIEVVLFKRRCEEKKYIIFFSNVKNNLNNFNSYNILNYSLKFSFQKTLGKPLANNFLKSSFFFNLNEFNLFIKNLKTNVNLVYFIKFKNLYIFNSTADFKKKFDQININAYSFMTRLHKLMFGWLPLLKAVVKESSK